MGCNTLAPGLGLLHADANLLFRELAHLARHPGDRFARQVDLDRVNPVLGKHAHAATHFLGSADNGADRALWLRQWRLRGVAESARNRDLLARREIARADNGAIVDGVSRDDVQT